MTKEICKICHGICDSEDLGEHIMNHGRIIQESLMGKFSNDVIKQSLQRVYYYGDDRCGPCSEKELQSGRNIVCPNCPIQKEANL